MLAQGRLAQAGEMISMIAHQWRQPLNNLSILMQSLVLQYRRHKLDNTKVEHFHKHSSATIKQMSDTIDDFRNFFRPDREKKNFEIQKRFDHIRDILSPILHDNQIDLIIDSPEKPIYLYGYANEFGQALINILNNAKDALIEQGIPKREIHMILESSDEEIRLTIEDNAGGINPHILDSIFDPYSSTKTEKNGTGLGLYIAKIVIEDHMEGVLKASNISNGARFEIIFAKPSS